MVLVRKSAVQVGACIITSHYVKVTSIEQNQSMVVVYTEVTPFLLYSQNGQLERTSLVLALKNKVILLQDY